MSDYSFVITPGASCTNCKNEAKIIVPGLIRCPIYGQYYNDDQAEHCINYCPITSSAALAGEGDEHERT